MIRATAVVCIVCALTPSGLRAQPEMPDNPYTEFLRGLRIMAMAEVVNAQARLVDARARAKIMEQEAENKRLENALKDDKLRLWRYQNLPTADELKWDQQVSKASHTPHINDILSARVLNTLLDDLKIMMQKGVQPRPGWDGRFPAAMDLKRVHVSCTKGNIGLLRKDGVLDWPLLLWRPDFNEDRDKIDKLAARAYTQAITQASGDRAKVLQELERAAYAMEEKMFLLSKQVGGASSPSMYMDAKKFFRQFEDMIEMLRLPNAGDYLSGRYEAKGATVQELAKHLYDNGLRFAAATAGSENAYVTLHRVLASYAQELRSAQTEKRLQSSPPGFQQ